MKFYEKHTLYSIGEKTRTDAVFAVEQPVFYRVRAAVVNWLDRLTWTVPGLKQVWKRSFDVMDAIARRRHQRNCHDDCGTFYQTDGPPGSSPRTPDRTFKGCVRMPLDAAWDVWIYHVTHKRKRTVQQFLSKEGPRSSEDRAADS
jgi:hypothetical protein